MKKICLLLSMLMFLACTAASAQTVKTDANPPDTAAMQQSQSSQPLKVAIMPIIADGYSKIQAQLYDDLTQQMNLSLNNTLERAVYLEGAPVMAAMEESGFIYKQNEDTLRHTAKLLNADVIVGYSVPVMYQQYHYTWMRRGEGPILQSYIRLKLWAYYKPLDKTIALSDSQQYFDDVSTAGMLTSLADDASYTLTKKADLKNLLKQSIQINETQKGDTK